MTTTKTLRVAIAQTCPKVAPTGPPDGDKPLFHILEENLLDAKDWVEKAHKENADVVVFPEYFLQGLVDSGRQYLTYPSKHFTTYLSSLAKTYNISIVGSIVHSKFPTHQDDLPTTNPFAHLSTTSSTQSSTSAPDLKEWQDFVKKYPGTNHDPDLENTAFYIDGGSGELVDEFVKRNLWHPERDYLKPGEAGHQVFDTKWGRCGFLICWDVSHPSSGQALSDLKADIVFAPTYWIGYDSAPTIQKHHPNPPSYEHNLVQALSYARAFETETAWIMVNAGGPVEEGYIGGSGVWMPLKGKLGGFEDGQVGLRVVDVDLGVLDDARALYKIRTDHDARLGG